jgi:hypothetical protein
MILRHKHVPQWKGFIEYEDHHEVINDYEDIVKKLWILPDSGKYEIISAT